MNCPRCGQPLAPNSAYCAYCHEPVAQADDYSAQYGYPAQQQPGYNQPGYGGYPQQNEYPQAGYGQPPYAQNQYPQVREYSPQQYGAGQQQANYGPNYGQTYGTPTGFQPAYGQARRPENYGPNPFIAALAALPGTVRGVFTKPGETLQGLVQQGDRFTGVIVLGVSLLFAFFSTMVGVGRLIPAEVLSSLLGISSGQVAPSVGGIAVVLRLLSTLLVSGVLLVYLCGFVKLRFSLELLTNLVAVTGLPLCLASILNLLLSLLSPYAGLMFTLCGLAVSFAYVGCIVRVMNPKLGSEGTVPIAICVAACTLLVFGLCALVGYGMVRGLLSNLVQPLMSMYGGNLFGL